MKKIKFLSLILSLFLLLCSCGESEKLPTSGDAEAKVKSEPQTHIATMLTVGDNLMHMPVVNDGKQEDGSYDYSHIFKMLQEDIVNADIAVIGQETVLGGIELGLSGYPLFNSPTDVGKSLVDVGFDVVLHASNHIMDRNIEGIEKTLEFWRSYPDVTVLGINESEEMKQSARIVEKNGIKFALFNYTYSTNGIPVPSGREYMVNMLDENKIESDIKAVDKKVDFVVVFPHWGNEYQMSASEYQQELARKMCEWGADAIIGSHPHVIQPCQWIKSDNGNECIVYYSLGNFVSRQKETKNLLGGMAGLEFTKTGDEKSIKAKYTPIVTQYDHNSRNFVVYKLSQYTNELAKEHGINLYDGALTKSKFEGIYKSVFGEAPDGIEMEY
ncbi:MAG: CapA family protein [Ruminococcaceae bacterium]|nr:CapA family protein [Oscillospiraceae bacterium]